MGVTNFPNGVNIGDSAGATSLWQLGGTSVDVTAAQLNAIAADSLSATELAYLDTVVAGTATASKALVLGAFKDIDVIDFQSATTPYKIAGSAVNTSASELNKLDAVVAGTASASKAVVLGAAKDIDTLDFAATSGIKIAGTAVSANAAQLNYTVVASAGTATASKAVVLGAAKDIDTIDFASFGGVKIAGVALAGVPLAYTAASARAAAGTVVVPGGASGTSFASGLTTVSFVVAGHYGDAGAGTASAGYAAIPVSGGSVTIVGLVGGTGAGGTAWGSGTATWIAIGT